MIKKQAFSTTRIRHQWIVLLGVEQTSRLLSSFCKDAQPEPNLV